MIFIGRDLEAPLNIFTRRWNVIGKPLSAGHPLTHCLCSQGLCSCNLLPKQAVQLCTVKAALFHIGPAPSSVPLNAQPNLYFVSWRGWQSIATLPAQSPHKNAFCIYWKTQAKPTTGVHLCSFRSCGRLLGKTAAPDLERAELSLFYLFVDKNLSVDDKYRNLKNVNKYDTRNTNEFSWTMYCCRESCAKLIWEWNI